MNRMFVLLSLLCAFSFDVSGQDAPKPPNARISGRVTAADTGRPIRWARVVMVSSQGQPSVAATDAQGRFSFEALAAGSYTLEARADRYVPMDFGGRPYTGLGAEARKPVTVRDGEHFDKADLRLPRGGAIEGRLLDEFGDPAPGLMVQVSQVVYAGGRRRLMPMGPRNQSLSSDDRGHFRLHGLTPGTYYLSVLSGVFAEQAESGGFAPTYYPGTTSLASAQPLTIGPGEEITSLTLSLTPARMARISGRVVDTDGNPIASPSLLLSSADIPGVSDFFVTRVQGHPDGTFTLRNVPPGRFTLQGFGRPPAGGPLNLGAAPFGWLPLMVEGSDVDGLLLRITTGTSLRGRIVADDPSAPPPDPKSVHVSAFAVEFNSAPVGGGPSPYEVHEDATFEVKNLSGQRVIRVSVSSPAWALKRVTRNGRDITDEPLDFSRGDITDVEVVVTNRVTSIEGVVMDQRGGRVDAYTVIIFASDPAKWTNRSRFIVSSRPAQDGTFSVRGLPPGDYFAVALAGTLGTEWQDPEFLKPLREDATGLLLGDGEAKKVTLKLSDR